MKQMRSKSVLIAMVIGAVSLVCGGVASAQEIPKVTQANTTVEQRMQEVRQRAEDAKAQAQTRADEAKARVEARMTEAKQRLEGKKLELCQAREQRITSTMEQMTSRGDKHYDVFTKIADRVKAFYTDKKLTVANYDALTAEVDAKAQAVEAAIASTKSVGSVFTCNNDNPKVSSAAFRDAFKAQVAALKDYRTSIKNLIVAVKSAQSNATQNNQTEEKTNE